MLLIKHRKKLPRGLEAYAKLCKSRVWHPELVLGVSQKYARGEYRSASWKLKQFEAVMHEKPKQGMGVTLRSILEAEIKEGFMEKKRLYLFVAAFFAALTLVLVIVSVTTGNVIYCVYALIPLIIAIALSALGGVLRLKR